MKINVTIDIDDLDIKRLIDMVAGNGIDNEDMLVENMDISTRLKNILHDQNIFTVLDVSNLYGSYGDIYFLSMENMGRKSLKELQDAMLTYGVEI